MEYKQHGNTFFVRVKPDLFEHFLVSGQVVYNFEDIDGDEAALVYYEFDKPATNEVQEFFANLRKDGKI